MRRAAGCGGWGTNFNDGERDEKTSDRDPARAVRIDQRGNCSPAWHEAVPFAWCLHHALPLTKKGGEFIGRQ